MKKLFYAATALLLLAGCNNGSDTKSANGDTSKTTGSNMTAGKNANLDMPYKLERPYPDWQPGDAQHAVTVMKGLKGFEDNDINACMASFGDSVTIRFDYIDAKMSNDSARKFFTAGRGSMNAVKVKMGDWESVKSADGKEEWVTLWYKQIVTDKNGKTDSADVINDAKIVNGKIAELHEATRHLGTPPAQK